MLRKGLYKIGLKGDGGPFENKTCDISTALPSAESLRTSLLLPKLLAQFAFLQSFDDGQTVSTHSGNGASHFRRGESLGRDTQNESTNDAERTSLYMSSRPPMPLQKTITHFQRGNPGNDHARGSMDVTSPSPIMSMNRRNSARYPLKSFVVYNDSNESPASEPTLDSKTLAVYSNVHCKIKNHTRMQISKRSSLKPLNQRGSRIAKARTSTALPFPEELANHADEHKLYDATAVRLPPDTGKLRGRNYATKRFASDAKLLVGSDSTSLKLDISAPKNCAPTMMSTISYSTMFAPDKSPILYKQGKKKSHTSNRLLGILEVEEDSLLDEVDAIWTPALEQNDVGKATAMGVFNKPTSSYNEEEFIRRRLRLYQGNVTGESCAERQSITLLHSRPESTNSGTSLRSGRNSQEADDILRLSKARFKVYTLEQRLATTPYSTNVLDDCGQTESNSAFNECKERKFSTDEQGHNDSTKESLELVLYGQSFQLLQSPSSYRCHGKGAVSSGSKKCPARDDPNTDAVQSRVTWPQEPSTFQSYTIPDPNPKGEEVQENRLGDLIRRHLRNISEHSII